MECKGRLRRKNKQGIGFAVVTVQHTERDETLNQDQVIINTYKGASTANVLSLGVCRVI